MEIHIFKEVKSNLKYSQNNKINTMSNKDEFTIERPTDKGLAELLDEAKWKIDRLLKKGEQIDAIKMLFKIRK